MTKLPFHLAEWHALAKLQFHTEPTIQYLKSATTMLGKQLHGFKHTTCSQFTTHELPKEAITWGQHQSQKQAKVHMTPSQLPAPAKPQPKVVSFNMSTYKVHSLGDYPATVIMYGPTDSYSTQMVISLKQLIVSLIG